ncbi:ABC transporter substrate-binding protein [Nocardiopsis coralliicola]
MRPRPTAPRPRTLAAALLAPALAASAASCGAGGDDGGSGDLTEATLTLNWYPYGEHAPFYYGLAEGIYEKHGIDLTINAGQGAQKTVQATGAGQTDFGWADTPALLAAVDKDMPVHSIGVYLQTTPASVQSFTETGIEEPADLEDRTIAGTAGDALASTFPVFLERNGLSEGDVKVQNTDPAGKMAAVTSSQVDGLMGFANDQGPIMQESSGEDVSYLRYSENNLNFFSNGLLVGEQLRGSDEELVASMAAATSEAWSAAIEDPEGAVASMEGASEQLPSEEVLTEQFETTTTLLHTDATEGEPPGTNTEADWEETISVFHEAGVIEEAREPAEYWQPAGGQE